MSEYSQQVPLGATGIPELSLTRPYYGYGRYLREVFGEPRRNASFLLVFGIKFDLGGRDPGDIFRRFGEKQFPHGKHLQPVVADHPHIEFPPLDVLLDNRVGSDPLVNEGHPLP